MRPARALLACACLALPLLWLVGRIATDRWTWSQFLFWLPTPAAALAAFAAAWAWPPRERRTDGAWSLATPRFVLTGIALLLAGLALARENRPFVTAPAEPPGVRPLRIVHCNIHWPGKADAPRVADWAIALPAELIVLSEPGWLLLDRRGAAFEAAGWSIARPGRFAILSRLPIVEVRVLASVPGITLTLLRIDASEHDLAEVAIGLLDLPSKPTLSRMFVAERVAALLEKAGAPPFDLILGDLNMTRGGAAIATVAPGRRSAWSDAGRGWGGSWPAPLPLWHIDHALLGPRVRAIDYLLVDDGFSLHRSQHLSLVPGE